MEDENILKTNDIGSAAALISSGIPLLNIDKTDPKKVIFIFPNNKTIAELVKEYWDNKLHVDAKTLLDSLKSLKSRIYSSI